MFVNMSYGIKKNSSSKVNNNNNVIKINVLEFMIHKHRECVKLF